MAKFEVTLTDQQYGDIESLVQQDDFLNWDQATEELVSMGLRVHDTDGNTETTAIEEEVFSETIEDQQDPARRDDSPDERTF